MTGCAYRRSSSCPYMLRHSRAGQSPVRARAPESDQQSAGQAAGPSTHLPRSRLRCDPHESCRSETTPRPRHGCNSSWPLDPTRQGVVPGMAPAAPESVTVQTHALPLGVSSIPSPYRSAHRNSGSARRPRLRLQPATKTLGPWHRGAGALSSLRALAGRYAAAGACLSRKAWSSVSLSSSQCGSPASRTTGS